MSTYPSTASLPQSGNAVSRWLLDEASGTRADIIASNTLADTNTVGAGTGYTDAGGTFDNSADFEADNSEYLSITDAAQSGLDITGDFAFSALIKCETLPGSGARRTFFGKWGGVGAESYIIEQWNDGGVHKLVFGMHNGTSSSSVAVAYTMSTSAFELLTFVYDASAGEGTFYIDGAIVGTTQTGLGTAIRNGTGLVTLGALDLGPVSRFVDGLMQDAIVWTGVELSDAEVTAFHDLYVTAPTTTSTTTTTTSSSTTTTTTSSSTSTTTTSSSTSSSTTTTSSSTSTTTTSSSTTTTTSSSTTTTTTSSSTTTTTTSSSTTTTSTSSSSSTTTTTTSSSTTTTTTTSTSTTTTMMTMDRPTFRLTF